MILSVNVEVAKSSGWLKSETLSVQEKVGFMEELNDQNEYVELKQNQCICFSHMNDVDKWVLIVNVSIA